jgi:hypothetical protein
MEQRPLIGAEAFKSTLALKDCDVACVSHCSVGGREVSLFVYGDEAIAAVTKAIGETVTYRVRWTVHKDVKFRIDAVEPQGDCALVTGAETG